MVVAAVGLGSAAALVSPTQSPNDVAATTWSLVGSAVPRRTSVVAAESMASCSLRHRWTWLSLPVTAAGALYEPVMDGVPDGDLDDVDRSHRAEQAARFQV